MSWSSPPTTCRRELSAYADVRGGCRHPHPTHISKAMKHYQTSCHTCHHLPSKGGGATHYCILFHRNQPPPRSRKALSVTDRPCRPLFVEYCVTARAPGWETLPGRCLDLQRLGTDGSLDRCRSAGGDRGEGDAGAIRAQLGPAGRFALGSGVATCQGRPSRNH